MRPKKTLAIGVTVLLVLTLLLIAVVSFSFIRHRQLCSYQAQIDSGNLNSSQESTLCPNILDSSAWVEIVKLAFNPSSLSAVQPFDPSVDIDLAATAPDCTDQLNPLCWITGTKPILKQTDGFTNLLLVGTDTRVGSGSNLLNTDTLMMVSLNQSTGQLMFISFPRDLYLDYKRPNGVDVEYKINAVYAIDGVPGIKGVIEQLTNRKVHYYAFIDLKLFEDVITELGGVNITLSEPFADYYPCVEVPKGTNCPNPKYLLDGLFGLFEFPKGENKLSAFDALVYTRARKNSSDFVRAERQQNLIRAIINNALDSDLPLADKVTQYLNFYQLFQERVVSNIELEDIAALLTFLEKLDGQAVQIVADTSLGGDNQIIYYLGILDQVGYSIGFRDRTHKQFQNYIDNIWDNLPYYIERPRVLVLDATGKNITKQDPRIKNILDNNQYLELEIRKTEIISSTTKVYSVSDKQVSGSIHDIKSAFPNSLIFNARIDDLVQSDYEEDIVVVVGD